MRITNNMIMGNTKTNINSTKVLVDKYNTQMTTQKKISKASEDPVIAIRSLRLSTSLSHLDQYKDNNIPDASSWMDVTETALSNMKSLLTDIRTQCVNGSTDTLTADDRNTILQQLTALSEQVYTEGNADYAGRTVFTGYRTSSKLTFQKDTKSTYQITQEFSAADLSEKRYYTNGVTVPNSINAATPDCTTDVTEHSFQRIRLGYGNTTDDVKLSIDGKELTQGTDYTVYKSVSDFDPSKLSADDTAYIQETGEFVFGKNVAASIKNNEKKLSVTYVKTGFDSSDARPEYYYNCKDITNAVTLDAGGNVPHDAAGDIIYSDPSKVVDFKFSSQEIKYTVANSTDITVNTQAKLKTYLEAAEQEADYADNNLQKTYSQYITRFDDHLNKVNLALTNSGSTKSRLTLIKNRVDEQQTTIEELKSTNEDRDISDIIIDFYAMYNAYQSSLTAASKANSQTLLDYL